MRSRPKLLNAWISICLAALLGACAPLHVVQTSPPPPNEELILVLPGFGMKRSTRADVRRFAASADSAGFDVMLADYRSYWSIDSGVESLNDFLEERNVGRYRRVHVFAFILGGYTFNRFLQKYSLENLGNVVYDRSPLQELAPELATTGWLTPFAVIGVGPVLAELAATPYSPIPRSDGTKIGLIIENRATSFVRKRKKRALAMRPLTFEPDSLGQPYDAVYHVPLNHDEMYTGYDLFGPELLHFFRYGDFSEDADRAPLGIDPWSKR